ncbi:HK97-gp10 family putative phage morphogenesis protein [Nocardioides sp. Arc9.136]|uniref:HK97-gp10 family putative phage morphogenesis protein n=1 Tax=Nocardioides sp. Arc9.136 TaxID=2996826 RepID=UPI0026651DA7|nr:HK97-gp10 family putative phage morphogenesis protein [Nocardioides sp. Arc9.136]WKN47147.1 HK97 gp10 family phage protein [Nocardioides sp. Arc9.136]
MSLTLDTSEVRALASRVAGAGGRIGAQGSAVLRRAALAVEADAKALAPVDTGNLRNSISTTVSGDGRFGAMSAEIGPTAEYGIYQEYGTSTQTGTPFMGPAADRQLPAYADALATMAAAAVL